MSKYHPVIPNVSEHDVENPQNVAHQQNNPHNPYAASPPKGFLEEYKLHIAATVVILLIIIVAVYVWFTRRASAAPGVTPTPPAGTQPPGVLPPAAGAGSVPAQPTAEEMLRLRETRRAARAAQDAAPGTTVPPAQPPAAVQHTTVPPAAVQHTTVPPAHSQPRPAATPRTRPQQIARQPNATQSNATQPNAARPQPTAAQEDIEMLISSLEDQ